MESTANSAQSETALMVRFAVVAKGGECAALSQRRGSNPHFSDFKFGPLPVGLLWGFAGRAGWFTVYFPAAIGPFVAGKGRVSSAPQSVVNWHPVFVHGHDGKADCGVPPLSPLIATIQPVPVTWALISGLLSFRSFSQQKSPKLPQGRVCMRLRIATLRERFRPGSFELTRFASPCRHLE